MPNRAPPTAWIGWLWVKPHNTPKEQHASVPVWNAEDWFYEDIVIGHQIRSIRRTISEGESMQFNALVLDMHPYVADEIFAREEGVFGKRLVAGDKIPGWTLSSRKGAEFVYQDAVGRYIDRFGFGAVLGAYGNLSAAKFRQLWADKMPADAPGRRGAGKFLRRSCQAAA